MSIACPPTITQTENILQKGATGPLNCTGNFIRQKKKNRASHSSSMNWHTSFDFNIIVVLLNRTTGPELNSGGRLKGPHILFFFWEKKN